LFKTLVQLLKIFWTYCLQIFEKTLQNQRLFIILNS